MTIWSIVSDETLSSEVVVVGACDAIKRGSGERAFVETCDPYLVHAPVVSIPLKRADFIFVGDLIGIRILEVGLVAVFSNREREPGGMSQIFAV